MIGKILFKSKEKLIDKDYRKKNKSSIDLHGTLVRKIYIKCF